MSDVSVKGRSSVEVEEAPRPSESGQGVRLFQDRGEQQWQVDDEQCVSRVGPPGQP